MFYSCPEGITSIRFFLGFAAFADSGTTYWLLCLLELGWGEAIAWLNALELA